MNGSANLDLITAFANLATSPHVLPTPARTAELDAVVRPLRRVAQQRFDASPVWARTADALDAITPARYGDILRAFADAEDERYAKHGPVEAIRRSQRSPAAVSSAATGLADPREASRE